jgi:hypothetical protein
VGRSERIVAGNVWLVALASTATACVGANGSAYVRAPEQAVVCAPQTAEQPTGTCRVAYEADDDDDDDDDEGETYIDGAPRRRRPAVTYVKLRDWRPAPSVQELETKTKTKIEAVRLRR